MPYYQTLKNRRESLHLSVLDVASQTRLKPEYLRAIEEHTLDLFSDDFSYVRYFVHAYADAIGVNWEMIKDEVDADISAFARARDGALHQASMKMIETMPSVTPSATDRRKKRKKRKQSFLENSASSLSRKMSWGNLRVGRLLMLVGGLLLVLLLAFSWLQNSLSASAISRSKSERTAALKEQEEETQRLAKDLQSRKDTEQTEPVSAPEIRLEGTDEENVYRVYGYTTDHPVVHLSFYAIGGQTVSITWNGVPAFSQVVSGDTSYDLAAGASGQLVVTFQYPSVYDSLSLDGTAIPANYTLRDANGANRIVLDIVYSEAPASTASQSSESSQTPADASLQEGANDEAPVDLYNEEDYTAPIELAQ